MSGERRQQLIDQIQALQQELTDLDRYRYRTILDRHGRRIEMRDDGYRISFRLPDDPEEDPNEWYPWAEYKQCNFPGVGSDIADALMAPADPARSR